MNGLQALTGDDRGNGDLGRMHIDKSRIVQISTHYKLSPEQKAFFKAQTGIDDDDALKDHILGLQQRAYKIFPFQCVERLTFLELGISKLPVYESVLKRSQDYPDGIFLDVGAFLGVDARKAAADGYPLKNIINADLYPEFGDLAHDLFRTTPGSYPINFVAGDVFKPEMLEVRPPFNAPPETEKPDLTTLTSLDPLAGHCTAIYTSRFFHLFSEERQLHVARALAGLLSPRPGSVIFGLHGSNVKKGVLHMVHSGNAVDMFCHSPESFAAMWDGQVFPKGKVRVDAKAVRTDRGPLAPYELHWSVVRL